VRDVEPWALSLHSPHRDGPYRKTTTPPLSLRGLGITRRGPTPSGWATQSRCRSGTGYLRRPSRWPCTPATGLNGCNQMRDGGGPRSNVRVESPNWGKRGPHKRGCPASGWSSGVTPRLEQWHLAEGGRELIEDIAFLAFGRSLLFFSPLLR